MAKLPEGLNIEWTASDTDRPAHPSNVRLHDYYLAKKPADGLPGRADFDLLDLYDIAPGLFIIEPDLARRGGIRYRLVGSDIEARLGISLTGRGTGAFTEPVSERLQALYGDIFTNQTIHILRGRFVGSGIEHVDYESFLLPMRARDGHSVNIIGGMFAFD